jgi:two-component system chemotaxis response regulator CheB
MSGSTVVVIGASAGGLDALKRLAAQLPGDFPAPIFVVHHMAADTTGAALLQAITQNGTLACTEAHDGEEVKGGHIYLAPADHHLLVIKGKMLVTKGARENRSRPGIDPLFRSAAVAYRSKVVGVLLTGYLDDGTAGMTAIHRCGGICVVQDPADAAYPDMPQNALNRVKIDHTVPLAEMGALLVRLLNRRPVKDKPVPKDIAIEAKIAERVLSDLPSVEALGDQVPFNCPGCGGVLWEVDKGNSALPVPHGALLLRACSPRGTDRQDRGDPLGRPAHVRGKKEPAHDHERPHQQGILAVGCGPGEGFRGPYRANSLHAEVQRQGDAQRRGQEASGLLASGCAAGNLVLPGSARCDCSRDARYQ